MSTKNSTPATTTTTPAIVTPLTFADLPVSFTVYANKFMTHDETFVLADMTLETIVGVINQGLKKPVHDGAALGEDVSDDDKRIGCEKRADAIRANTHGWGHGGGSSLDVAMRPYLLAYLIEIKLAKKTSDAEKYRVANGKTCRAVYDNKIKPHLIAANPTVAETDIDQMVWVDGIESPGKADMIKPVVKLGELKLTVAKAETPATT